MARNECREDVRELRTNGTVETWRTAAAEPIFAQRLDSTLLDEIVPGQTSKVVRSKVEDGFAIRSEFGFGASRTGDDWDRGEVGLFFRAERGTERFGIPFVYEFVDFLEVC